MRYGGGGDFEVVLKMKKVRKSFQILFIKKHLRTFRKNETMGREVGGAAILKLSHRDRI